MMKNLRLILITMMMFHFGNIFAQMDSIQPTKKQTTKTQLNGHGLRGKASYYGDHYKSTRTTANGEKFNKNTYTAAHKTLPFGTVVKVTNTQNGKSVTVRINDRGPFISGRVIDVTPVAARELGMIKTGVAPCELQIISTPEPKKKKNRNNYS